MCIRDSFTTEYKPADKDFTLDLPSEFHGLEEAITGRLDKFLPRDFVKNARKREAVKYNKRVELNPEFQALWAKISQKTRYSVEFKTDDLVKAATGKIAKMAKIEPVKIEITKRELDIGEAGLVGGRITSNRTFVVSNEQPLPDILAFLQRETELTRETLVRILKESGRLKDFSVNPQAFMSEVAKLTNRALNELIIEGVKYEPIAGQFFEMRLFESELSPLGEYLDRLYQVQSKDDRTPYDHIVWESDIEREVAERLDADDRIKFFCKLPRWFKVATPLGDYNPDWALVIEETNKLYLVRETKSTLDRDERRETENRKIDCGKAHFQALGVDFKDAASISDVLS